MQPNVVATNCTTVGLNDPCQLSCTPGWELDNDGLVRCTTAGAVVSAAGITCNCMYIPRHAGIARGCVTHIPTHASHTVPCRINASTVQPNVDLDTCRVPLGAGDTCSIKCVSNDYVPPDYFQNNILGFTCEDAGTQWDVSAFTCKLGMWTVSHP